MIITVIAALIFFSFFYIDLDYIIFDITFALVRNKFGVFKMWNDLNSRAS